MRRLLVNIAVDYFDESEPVGWRRTQASDYPELLQRLMRNSATQPASTASC
jgi:hypothetical protein